MIIISHRGYWKTPEEKNCKAAFERSFALGYGTETDIRDRNRDLVIAHDMASEADMPLDEFFTIYKSYHKNLPLALNIKADGLAVKLKEYLEKYDITNYFLFDMSVPDQKVCLDHGLKSYTRVSDLEPVPTCYDRALGVWLDAFYSDWYQPKDIQTFLNDGKPVCLVSSDLHKRDYKSAWRMLKDNKLHHEAELTLCTDFPEEASTFFGLTA